VAQGSGAREPIMGRTERAAERVSEGAALSGGRPRNTTQGPMPLGSSAGPMAWCHRHAGTTGFEPVNGLRASTVLAGCVLGAAGFDLGLGGTSCLVRPAWALRSNASAPRRRLSPDKGRRRNSPSSSRPLVNGGAARPWLRMPSLAMGHRTHSEGDSGNREGSSRRVPLPRPAALLRVAADRGRTPRAGAQTRLRHASPLNTYGHIFPDKDESARAAVAAALAARADSVRTQGVVTAL
jgi:hypothetical protein